MRPRTARARPIPGPARPPTTDRLAPRGRTGAARETGLLGERPPDAPECIRLANDRPRASSASGTSVREAICRRSPGDDARLVLAPVCAPCPDRSGEPPGRVRGDPVARTRPGTRDATKNVVFQDICEYLEYDVLLRRRPGAAVPSLANHHSGTTRGGRRDAHLVTFAVVCLRIRSFGNKLATAIGARAIWCLHEMHLLGRLATGL